MYKDAYFSWAALFLGQLFFAKNKHNQINDCAYYLADFGNMILW